MKKQTSFFFILFPVLMLAGASGCMKKQSFPDTPAISLLSFEMFYDTARVARTGIMTISYQDGNGDIGLSPGDTFSPFQPKGPYYYNYVINVFEKENGVFTPLVLAFPLSLRIPVLTPDDPNKAISGYIVDTIPLYPPPPHDTLKFEAFLYDRALNKSNVITTPEIILRRK